MDRHEVFQGDAWPALVMSVQHKSSHQFCPHQWDVTNAHQPQPLVLSPLMLFHLTDLVLSCTSSTIIASSVFSPSPSSVFIIFASIVFLLSFCRVDCTFSSYSTTIQLVECACSSWSSLSASQFLGSMVSHTHMDVFCPTLNRTTFKIHTRSWIIDEHDT